MEMKYYVLRKDGDGCVLHKFWHGTNLPLCIEHSSHFQRYFVILFPFRFFTRCAEHTVFKKTSYSKCQQMLSMPLFGMS